MAYRLLMLDFDGVLADSFPFFRHTFNQLAAHHGFRPVAADELPALRRYPWCRRCRPGVEVAVFVHGATLPHGWRRWRP